MIFEEILAIYQGSDGKATMGLYSQLGAYGPVGAMAVNVFRACKASERAKLYRGGGYRGQAYEKKDWSIGNLCDALRDHGEALGIVWGWGRDDRAVGFENVLYVDLPTGQISFHNAYRKDRCPDYGKPWDGMKGQAPTRICRWIATIFKTERVTL